jgi:hypothetical protein
VTRRLVVTRDVDSPTAWTGTWLDETDGRIERATSTPVDPVLIADECEAAALAAFEARR